MYLFNWITDPEHRGQGHGGRLFKAVCETADRMGIVLVTHPDTPALQETMEHYGFREAAERPAWEGKPYMRRLPVPYEPPYEVVNV